jgi:hypothetical protein
MMATFYAPLAHSNQVPHPTIPEYWEEDIPSMVAGNDKNKTVRLVTAYLMRDFSKFLNYSDRT